jgi:hypothetical protein
MIEQIVEPRHAGGIEAHDLTVEHGFVPTQGRSDSAGELGC